MSDEIVTTDLAEFGYRELELATELLNAYTNDNTTARFEEEFEQVGVRVMTNRNFGTVFLTNKEYQVAMINYTLDTPALDIWYDCPVCGAEGWADGEEGINWNYDTGTCGACANAEN